MKRSLLAVSASLALLSMTGVAQAAADINAGQQKVHLVGVVMVRTATVLCLCFLN